MELQTNANYRLIEGPEKQSLLDHYINQLGDLDRGGGMEVFQISSNLSLKQEKQEAEEGQSVLSNFIRNNFNSEAPAYTNNQSNISSLSTLISKSKTNKTNQISYQTRNSRDLSMDNLAETIRSIG